jgi:hypothetical protein
MGLRSWWAELVERLAHRGRVRGTWRTRRRCGSYSYQTSKSGLRSGYLILCDSRHHSSQRLMFTEDISDLTLWNGAGDGNRTRV